MDSALARRNLRKFRKEQSQIGRSKSRLTLRELPAPSGSLKKECGGNRAARCSESQSGASVHDDSRDRLVDFMCHGGGHFAEQSEAVEPACCRRTFAFGDEKPERRAGVPNFRIESLDVSLGRGGVEMSLKK